MSDISSAHDSKEAQASPWKAAIDYKWTRENKEAVAANIKNRNSKANIDLVLQLYDSWMNAKKEADRLRAERNAVANKMKGKLEPAECQKLIEEGKNLKEGLVSLEEDLLKLENELQQEAQCVPNMTHPDVPLGGEDCFTVGQPHEFSFPVKDHVQLGKDLDLFDFDAAAEVYSIEGSDQCLIGTAEIPVGGIHMDSILSEVSLPLEYVAFSHCFRTEAGAATRPEESDSFRQQLIQIEESSSRH